MALPGLSFEIVRAQPSPVLRSDRTAVIGLTQRGPTETPVLVESYDEFVEQFGDPVDGMLTPLLAKSYFDNGGQDLVVTRFVPQAATPATGRLPLAGASGVVGATLNLRTRDVGDFGNAISVSALLDVRKRAKAVRSTTVTNGLDIGPLTAPVFLAADVGLPVRLVGQFGGGVTEAWRELATVNALSGGVQTIVLSGSIPGTTPSSAPMLVELYERTFTLRIEETGRLDVFVPGLDVTAPTDMATALASTTVVLDSVSAAIPRPDLPLPGPPVALTGGNLGMADNPAQQGLLAMSFGRAIAALELSDLPDVVVAPDLWNSIFSTKGIDTLTLAPDDAIALADEMVQSAARTLDRVVILDPPLVDDGNGGVRPMTVTELETWRQQRQAVLLAARDFAASYTPWTRIVAAGVFRGDTTLLVPPSMFVAGKMALVARELGPWHATGNVTLENVVGLGQTLSLADQEALQDVGINPLDMELPGGATIGGVRSLSWPDRQPWRFLSTRRLFNFLHRALLPIGLSYVFEPNSPRTWILLRRDIERLLNDLFVAGGLAGQVPQDAFFVKIDAEVNPPDQRDNGVLTALIAIAPTVPLEFLLVRLSVDNGIARVTEEPIKQ